MTNLQNNVLSLRRITQLPLDFNDPIYSYYPLLKMGVQENVLYYAKMLAPLVEEIMAANPNYTDWVLTSPAYHAIPSAANLMCWCIDSLLKNKLPESLKISVINIRENKRDIARENPVQLRQIYEYSKLDCQERIKSREDSNSLIIKEKSFANLPVIFINDINVTGTQQRGMENYFKSVNSAIVRWLYVIDVEESIGKLEPKIEYSINNFNQLSLEEFGKILDQENIQYTGKCIWKIFFHTIPEMEQLFSYLDTKHRLKILELATGESSFNGEYFQEKMDLLRAFCNQIDKEKSTGEKYQDSDE